MATATVKKNTAVKAVKKAAATKATKTVKATNLLEATVFDMGGKKTDTIKLPDTIFGLPWNADLLHQVVLSYASNMRTPIAHTKNRGEVRGGGRKPWRQKGTGRARHGSIRSPIWIGGGVSFGPRKDRNYEKKVNRKMSAKALFVILSKKLKEQELIFVDNIAIPEPKTKTAVSVIDSLAKVKDYAGLGTDTHNAALVLLPTKDRATEKSFRNIPGVIALDLRNVNPTHLMTYKYVIIAQPENAISFFEGKLIKKGEKKSEK